MWLGGLRGGVGGPSAVANSVRVILRTPRSVVIQGPSDAHRGHGIGSVSGLFTWLTCRGALAAWSLRGTSPGGVSKFPIGLGRPGGAIGAHSQFRLVVERYRAITNRACVIAPPTVSDATTLHLEVYPSFDQRVVVSLALGPCAHSADALSQNSITRRGRSLAGVLMIRSSQNVPCSSISAGRGLWSTHRSTNRQSNRCCAR